MLTCRDFAHQRGELQDIHNRIYLPAWVSMRFSAARLSGLYTSLAYGGATPWKQIAYYLATRQRGYIREGSGW